MTITETRVVSVRGRTRPQTGNVQINTDDDMQANTGIDVEPVTIIEQLLVIAPLTG